MLVIEALAFSLYGLVKQWPFGTSAILSALSKNVLEWMIVSGLISVTCRGISCDNPASVFPFNCKVVSGVYKYGYVNNYI